MIDCIPLTATHPHAVRCSVIDMAMTLGYLSDAVEKEDAPQAFCSLASPSYGTSALVSRHL